MKGLVATVGLAVLGVVASGGCSSSSVNPSGNGGMGGASGSSATGGGAGTGGNSPCFDACDGTNGHSEYKVIVHNCACGTDVKCTAFCGGFCAGKAALDQDCVTCVETNTASCVNQGCTGACSQYRACVTACH